MTALVLSLALLVGLPYVALAVLEWPALDPSLTEVVARLRGGNLPPGLGTAVIILALWAVWVLYLVAVVAEVAAWVRGRAPRLRPLGPLQVVAATAIGASLTTPAAAHAATPAPAAVTEAPTTDPEPSPQPTPAEPGDLPVSGEQAIERARVVDGFGYDSAALSEQMKTELAPTVSMIRTHAVPDQPVRVTGHTDAAGDAAYNQQLSQERAEAVAEYLRDRLGQDAPAIEPRGEGETQPLDEAGAASQRRAEITYTVTPQPQPRPPQPPGASGPEHEPQNTPSPKPAEEAPQQEADNSALTGDDQAVIVVKLPGGVLLTSMAAGGVAAGFALGRRRAGPPPTPARHAHTAAPRRPHPNQPHRETSPETADEQAAAELGTATVVDLSAGGLGITGPGAPGAARSLIAPALTTNEDAPLRLIIPRSDADDLLGAQTTARLAERHTPALTLTPDLSHALTLLHTELLARPDSDDEAPPTADAHPSTPVLLIASPDADHTAELRALLAQGRTIGIAALLLGGWPRATVTVNADHTLTTTDTDLDHLTGAHWPATDTDTLAGMIAALPARGRHRTDLRVLGPITLTTATGPVALRRRAAFEVAAYLAAHPDGPRLERAVEDMWHGEATHRANRRFHDAISALRSAVGGDQLILHENGRYRLNPAAVRVDLWDLQGLLAATETDPGDARARARLDRAAADFTDLAAEADYTWVEPLRLELRRRLIGALLSCAASGAADDPRPLLARAAAIDPRHTEAQRVLIRAHLDHDDSTAALQAFRTYKTAMAEIDAQPDATIRELVKNIGNRA
ncbi:OmpA family protein [Streptomonospora arabica]|uniref:OmpA family protein n=1 Tax=Streptomonospora arabica TaxID=412417 RepID=A0ABV9SK65_9ACTN